MNSSINIVYLLTFLDSQTGGMERQALQLATKLREKKCSIFFVTCAHIGRMRREHWKIVDTFHGFRVYRIPLIGGWRRINALIYFLGSLGALLLFKNRYTIIHAHQLNTSGLIACAAKSILPSKKIIVKNCSGGAIGDINQIKKFSWNQIILKFMRRNVDRFIAVSDETNQEMLAVGLKSIVLIQNGVDTKLFSPISLDRRNALRKEILGDKADKRVVLFVGRLVVKKNVFMIIEALARIKMDLILLVVGDGPLRSKLEADAEKLQVKDKVIFFGAQKDVHKYYQIADVFVLPSDNEGLPNSLIEAMGCGVPPVGSNIKSIEAIIKHDKNGYLFNYYDNDRVGDLAEKIKSILVDDKVHDLFSDQARKTIEKCFSFEYIEKKYLELYNELE